MGVSNTGTHTLAPKQPILPETGPLGVVPRQPGPDTAAIGFARRQPGETSIQSSNSITYSQANNSIQHGPRPRADCQVCGRSFIVLQSGLLTKHGPVGAMCTGSSQPPGGVPIPVADNQNVTANNHANTQPIHIPAIPDEDELTSSASAAEENVVINEILPPYTNVANVHFNWGDRNGEDLKRELNAAYEKMVLWRRNLFPCYLERSEKNTFTKLRAFSPVTHPEILSSPLPSKPHY